MLKGLVYCADNNLYEEISGIASMIPNIEVECITDLKKFQKILHEKSILFAFIAPRKLENIASLRKICIHFPQIHFIYYHSSLNINNFQFSDFTGFSHIIAGETRKSDISELLVKLTNNYWKKIPYEKMGISYNELTPRLRKVMNYIETHELKQCSTSKISKSLDISQGYLSQEFKRETGQTFRGFMQNLLDYYETLIFDRLELSAKTASRILGYSELSSFSRSFKMRKGYPPSQQKRKKNK